MMGRIEHEGITFISTFVRILNRIIREKLSLSSCTPEHNNNDDNNNGILRSLIQEGEYPEMLLLLLLLLFTVGTCF